MFIQKRPTFYSTNLFEANMAKGCSLQTVNRGLSRGIVRVLILQNFRRHTAVWIFFLTFTATSNSLFGFSKSTCVAGKEVIIHFTVGLRHALVHDRQKGGNRIGRYYGQQTKIWSVSDKVFSPTALPTSRFSASPDNWQFPNS